MGKFKGVLKLKCDKKDISCLRLYCLYAVFILNAVILISQAGSFLELKLSRLRMANGMSDRKYFNIVYNVSIKHLKSPSYFPLDDKQRLVVCDYLVSYFNKPFLFSWPYAMLAKGIMVADSNDEDRKNIEALEKYYARFIKPGKGIVVSNFSLSQAMHGEMLIYLKRRTGESIYDPAIKQLANYLLIRHRQEGGSLRYCIDNDIYLVDSLGMICPFMAEYGFYYEDPEATALAINQLKTFIENAIDPQTGLPFHGYSIKNNEIAPVGLLGWGRGTGWYAIGLIDTLKYLPANYKEKYFFEQYIVRLASVVRSCQRIDGGWGSIINAPSLFDSSATAMIAYFLQRAMMDGIIDESYEKTIRLAIEALKNNTRYDGVVDFAEGNCMDLNNFSTLYRPAPYTQGLVLALMSLRKHSQGSFNQSR